MKRKKTCGLYDPYLDTLGGGEKHILSILQALAEFGYDLEIFWDKNLSKEIHDKFSLRYVNRLKFSPNIFQKKGNLLEKFSVLRSLDLFFYVTDGSYFFSSAKKNFVFCMVPDKDLYLMTILNKLKLFNYSFITNSFFTQKWLEKWGIKSKAIFPYVSREYISLEVDKLAKEKIILSVGRFFPQLHSKQHSVLIDWFTKIQKKYPEIGSFKLVIAGGLKTEDSAYFNSLKERAAANPNIRLIPNLSFEELIGLYKKSLAYIHVTGYGIDENLNPELVEHLGITPLEAMSAGCVTFCYKAGGPKEFLEDGVNGYLFTNLAELTEKLLKIISDESLRKNIAKDAHDFVADQFRYDKFKEQVKGAFL